VCFISLEDSSQGLVRVWLEEVIEDEDGNMFMDLFFPIK